MKRLRNARWQHFAMWALIAVNTWMSIAEVSKPDKGPWWLLNQLSWMGLVAWLIWGTVEDGA